MNILMIGYGVVGKLEYEILKKFNPDIYDKNGLNTKRNIHYDLAVVAVPTPLINGKCNVSEVWNAINENDAEVYLIKSTVAVGTCDEIANKTGKRIVMSPEHSGATQHCNNFDYDFTILGGTKEDCSYVQQIYQEVYDARHTFKWVDRKTAELSKYAINTYLAWKVAFCMQFNDICNELNIPYEELRECFTLDERIGKPHTFIYKEHPYWDSHCFNKDLPAIANQFNMSLLKEMIKYNNSKKERNKR